MDTTRHRELLVKVNTYVDEGVAALVAALNELDGVMTLDGCESGERGAYVYFVSAADGPDLTALAGEIAGVLRAGLRDPVFLLSVEWEGSNDDPRALLSVPREHVGDVVDVLGSYRRYERRP